MPPLKLMPETEGRSAEEIVQAAISTVREYLGMEISYLSEFVDGRSVFRAVDAPGLEELISVGDSRDLNEVYCQRILDGELPELIPDTRAEPGCMALPITTETPIGSHVSVPIRRADGTPYGMFCCLSPKPNPSLTERDLAVMRIFAGLAAEQVNGALGRRDARDRKVAALEAITSGGALKIVYQPIADLRSGEVRGFEALSRFEAIPYRTPDLWFADASSVGMGVDLELRAIRAALAAMPRLPEGTYLSVNASPETAASTRLREALDGAPLERIVLELTEHDRIDLDGPLPAALRYWRARGLRIAIDDAGAGYAGFQQILRIAPDILKLDRSLVTEIDADPARRALVAAMVHFADETGMEIVAEGVETDDEAEVLLELGMHVGQGFHLGRPAALDAALAACAGAVGGGARVA